MGLNVKKIFVVHYKKLLDRKKYIEDFFSNNNIVHYEFREKYQREELTNDIKKSYFMLDNLSPAQICITIEHIEIFREILKSEYDGWYLILEDDAKFVNNFIGKLNNLLLDVPNDAEYLDISNYFNLNSSEKWVRQTATRTNVSYLIKKSTCEKILKTIIPFEYAIDHELNKQFKLHNISVYWSGESLISQGSYGSSYIYFK